jgi:hypothetical protein
VLGDRACHQQQIGMTGTGYETDAETFKVVKWIVERVDLELAAVAGARVDVADAQCTPEHSTDVIIETNCDASGHVTLPSNDHLHRHLCIRLARQIAAKIERSRTRSTGKAGESEAKGKFWRDSPRAVKSIAYARMLIIDRA